MAVTVSLINMKGGVGKTTLAAQFAHAVVRRYRKIPGGYSPMKVLAVDLDPQANLSQALLSPEVYARHLRDKKPTVVQIFDGYSPPTRGSASPRQFDLSDVIMEGRIGLDLIVSQLELSYFLEAAPKGTERRLAQAMAQITNNYDLILIDCAPTESILTKAAYHASRYLLVPVKPEYLATIGLPLLESSIQAFKAKNSNHELDICGIVFNHSSSYKVGAEEKVSIREVQTEARKNGWHIFENHVPHSRTYPKAAREGRPIGSTSNVRHYTAPKFSLVVDEFLAAVGLGKEEA